MTGDDPLVEPVETPAPVDDLDKLDQRESLVEPVETADRPEDLDNLYQRTSLVEPVETASRPDDLDKLDQRTSLVELVETPAPVDDLDKLDQQGSLDARSFRRGVRLALDWGKARVGVAACDPDGTLAYPVETVPAQQASRRLPQLIDEYEPVEVIIGLPRTLAGGESFAADYVRTQAAPLIAANPLISWRFSDERLTTVEASRRLRSAGRNSRRQRAVIDQAAAVAILEQALAVEKATGAASGEPAR